MRCGRFLKGHRPRPPLLESLPGWWVHHGPLGTRLFRLSLPLTGMPHTMKLSLVLGMSLALPASAQELNIDFGSSSGMPAATHTAAGEAGVWNTMALPLAGPLVDRSGAVTGVTVDTLTPQVEFAFDNLFTTGDDEALLDDGFDPGAADALLFSGLADDDYVVVTYAWPPDDEFFETVVEVVGAQEGPQVVGGPWTGSYEVGEQYALHHVTVTGGTLRIDLGVGSGFATCNGVQILRDEGLITTNYCVAGANSISPAGSSISATGSASLSDANVTLRADQAPDQFAVFYFGPDVLQVPFGNGFRCVGGMVTRMPVVTGSGGLFEYSIDFATYGAELGSLGTARFQCWYRDPAAGGAAFNLSDGLEVTFVP